MITEQPPSAPIATMNYASLSQLVARWWHAYDEGEFETMRSLLTDDIVVRVRTDSGQTEFEDFIRADVAGIDEAMAWFTDHRLDSPFPLRHHCSNLFIAGEEAGDVRFRAYLLVTNVVGILPGSLSTGIVTGSARPDPGAELGANLVAAKLASLEIRLDMTESVNLRELRS